MDKDRMARFEWNDDDVEIIQVPETEDPEFEANLQKFMEWDKPEQD
jgi:hypothetical protein